MCRGLWRLNLTVFVGPIYLVLKHEKRHSQRDYLLHHGHIHVHECRRVGFALSGEGNR